MNEKKKSTFYLPPNIDKEMRHEAVDKDLQFPSEFILMLWEHYKQTRMDRPEWLIDNYYCPGCGMAISPKDERPEKSDVAASYLFTFTCDCCGGRFEILDRLCGKGRRSDWAAE